MKRTFPEKVKPVTDSISHDLGMDESKQAASGVNRRARTSAAMIGLALSMGAANLLLPHQDEGALAAEPQTTEATTTATAPIDAIDAQATAPSISPVAVTSQATVSTQILPTAAVIDHVVRPGQTLWQLARRYHTAVDAIAAANSITASSVLRAGQILKIPVDRATLASLNGAEALPSDRSFQTADATVLLDSTSRDSQLKAEQDDALNQLQQSRQKLRDSLAELRSETSQPSDASVADATQSAPKPTVTGVDVAATAIAAATLPETAPSQTSASGTASHYQVKPGDTLSAIARAHSIASRDLAAANHLTNPNWLRTNQSLLLPSSATASSTTQQPRPAASQPKPADAPVPYRVNSGDTIGTIADRYNVSQSVLVNANGLHNPNQIAANQVLTIPAATAPAARVSDRALPIAPSAPVALQPSNLQPSSMTPAGAYYPMVSVPTVPSASENSETAAAPSAPDARVRQVASAPASEATSVLPARTPQQPATTIAANPTQGSNPYVENLMVEILNLRDRYRSEESARVAAPTTAPTASIALRAVSPGSSHDPFTEAFQAEARRLRQEQQSQQTRSIPQVVAPPTASTRSQTATAPATSGQVVAVAPLGSENYAPLVQPMTGRMVSPDLPPLAAADAYLPQGATAFSGYQWPARGVITSGYGWRWGRMHRGIDIGAPIGTPVMAAAGGVVEFAGWNSGGYGNLVDIRHPDGSLTRYAHNSRLLVRTGQQIQQGQQISEVGSTGYSTGPHLHFEVHPPNQGAVNPVAYLPPSR